MRIMLSIGAPSLAAASALTLAAFLASGGSALAASAVQKECSTKYQAAKAGGTLNGMSYNQYYKQCAAEAKAEKTAPATAPTTAPVAPAAPASTTTATAPVAPAPKIAAKAPAASTSGAILPAAIAPSFASQTPHLGRLHTCAEQWKTNKAANANGNLKWPAYYSECNTRLKG